MKTLILSAAIMLILFTGAYGRGVFLDLEQNADVSSTAIGGPWSAPSTWVGGVVPAAGDNVTIAGGATVIIDTTASANSVTVGGTGSIAGIKSIFSEGGTPAALRFGETGAFSLTVTGDVTIGPSDSFTTGGGNANQHVLTMGGNLTNNGTFDLSTNDGMAAAMLIFTGNSNSTFGGAGPVTDISWITIEKGATNATVELSVANFSVRGSTSDTPDSGYLFLNHGTFKISGTFTCANRTFYNNAYEIAQFTGFWLNNPNYTVVAQHQPIVQVFGQLRVTAGTYDIGTELDDSLVYFQASVVTIEGGFLNVAGVLRSAADGSVPALYNQSGGIVTVCAAGHSVPAYACFDSNALNSGVLHTGGEIVIQNSPPADCCLIAYRAYPQVGLYPNEIGTVRFGNAASDGPARFRATGAAPNLVVDTTAGAHTVWAPGTAIGLEIGPGGRFEMDRNGTAGFYLRGETLINNGTISSGPTTPLYLWGLNTVYSGSGVIEGALKKIILTRGTLTLNSVNNLRVHDVVFTSGRIINSNKLTIGNNDAVESWVMFEQGAALDSGFDVQPVFDLGTGGEVVSYHRGPWTTGVEINPQRKLKTIFAYVPGTSLTIAGGDLDVGLLNLQGGPVIAGPNKIKAETFDTSNAGHVDGTVILRITNTGFKTIPVGKNGYSPIHMDISAFGPSPSYLVASVVDSTLPGLLLTKSASRYWKLEEIGNITASMMFIHLDGDVSGNETNYKIWLKGGGGPPELSAGCMYVPEWGAIRTRSGITDFNGSWGVGEQLDTDPLSISGTVTRSGGQPIGNALLTLSGGGLPAPIQVVTGNFGTYTFSNLQAGATYTVRVDAKRFRFSPSSQQVTPVDDILNLNFTANP